MSDAVACRLERAPDWVRTVPELRTRPHFVAAMVDDPKLRRLFFRHVEMLAALPDRLYGLPKADWILSLVYAHGQERLAVIEKRIPERLARAEMMGAYRNVFQNARMNLADGKKFVKRRCPFDVLRLVP